MKKIAELEDAIEKNSLVGIYSVFYTIAHGDPNFSTGKFRMVMEYVKSKNIDGFIQKFDGEEFETEEKWDEDYWALIASSLIDNFCLERINHLEAVGKRVYPIKVVEQSKSVIKSASTQVNTSKCDDGINENPRRAVHTTTRNKRNNREEQKCKGKSNNVNRSPKDDGGLLSKIPIIRIIRRII